MDWMEFAQTLIALVGFGAVVFQMSQIDMSIRSAARASIYDLAAGIKQIIVGDPDMRPYFFAGKEIREDDERYEKAVAIADFFCLYLEKIATQGEGVSAENREAWHAYIRDIYRSSPVLQQFLDGKKAWYSEEFWRALGPHA